MDTDKADRQTFADSKLIHHLHLQFPILYTLEDLHLRRDQPPSTAFANIEGPTVILSCDSRMRASCSAGRPLTMMGWAALGFMMRVRKQ